MYTDSDYYNWDFQMENASSVVVKIHQILFYVPLAVALLVAFLISYYYKLKKAAVFIGFILSALVFRFIDVYIRELFLLTSNPRINTFISLIFFVLLFVISIRLSKKLESS